MGYIIVQALRLRISIFLIINLKKYIRPDELLRSGFFSYFSKNKQNIESQ